MNHAACPSLHRLHASRGACAGRHLGRCVAGHRGRGRVPCRGAARTQVVVVASAGDGGEGDTSDQVSKFVSKTANTFAPKASGKTSKNPAYPGSALYTIFEVQAWLSVAVGGLLAFNLIWPTDGPSIPRLLGMWSVWMMAVPSLRARDCPKREKDALNVLFLAIPVVNVALPFVWKSFSAAFTADVALLAALYISNGALDGFPDLPEEQEAGMQPPPPPPPPPPQS